MNARFKMHKLCYNYTGYFIIKPITLTILFILIVFNSCIKIKGNQTKVEGYVSDIISHEVLDNAEVQILEWYESWFYPGSFFSATIDSGYTDAKGHFLINYHSNDKHSYSLRISRDGYFKDEGLMGSVTSINKMNIGLFPHGFVKTHITNKIDSARWIEIYFTPFYLSQEIYRDGFMNTQLFDRAYADTSIITTTIGGVMNNLKILINLSDYIPDARVVKDTSLLTLKHDTIYLNIILF
jgi:hypothetical protein